MAASPSGQYWVTWADTSNTTAAKASAVIWGPQATAPAQLAGFFQGGPFPTKAAAQAYKDAIGSDIPKVPNPLSGVNAIGDFFGRLTEAQTWERVGLVVVGVMFLGIGIISVASSSKTGQAVKKTASKMPVII